MSGSSKIEWTDTTWNPVTGCTKVSPGCDHCYAERFAERWRGIKGHAFEHGFDVQLRPARLEDPFGWKKPRRVFVNSMSDLFHKDVPDEFIKRVFDVLAETPQHTYQVLTKRPERMLRWVRSYYNLANRPDDFLAGPYPNVWLGVSIENADYAWRADMLRETPAAVRFLSLEPLLGHIPAIILRDMDWVIVGGESGPGARPMHEEWARDIRDDCANMSIPFFFKQWGAWVPAGRTDATHLLRADGRLIERKSGTQRIGVDGRDYDFVDRRHPGWVRIRRVPKVNAGRELDGRTHNEYPQSAAVDGERA